MKTIDPADDAALANWDAARLETALAASARALPTWAETPLAQRCDLLRRAAGILRAHRDLLARLITGEMGKLHAESLAEIEKSALGCEYYAEHAAAFLADEIIPSDAGRSYVAYQPLGTVLAIMPWNFPFWQVFRFAAPALAAGNTALLKHAANVPRCALAIEEVLREAGAPTGVFTTLMVTVEDVARVIADERLHAVTLTGSEGAGRQVAAAAGAALKKTVLELGGSDPFIVLEDADLDLAVATAVTSRFANAGQSCIAAKRFIVVEAIADEFLRRFRTAVEALQTGDPFDSATTLAPLARADLRDALHRQVEDSIARGAVAVTGCAPLPGAGAYYAASILDRVRPGMPAFDEELFGPVASVARAADEATRARARQPFALRLGASVCRDTARGERIGCGCRAAAPSSADWQRSAPASVDQKFRVRA